MSIRELVQKHNAQKIDAHADYCDAYERQFAWLRNSAKMVLEIGVKDGQSLRMWKEYFPYAEIYGMDIDTHCLKHQDYGINILIGDQSDKKYLTKLVATGMKFDIIIDDGSHNIDDQWVTFRYLFPIVHPGGVYVIEDLHTSYWPRFGGGITRHHFIVMLVDALHAKHWKRNPRAKGQSIDADVMPWESEIKSIKFYDSIAFVEKKL